MAHDLFSCVLNDAKITHKIQKAFLRPAKIRVGMRRGDAAVSETISFAMQKCLFWTPKQALSEAKTYGFATY